ncbi:MAG TPA: beta-ketoacyl-ACP synthase II [Rectinemataceae bacterium]|nr:beta-ketoacyl-ACP synthase II [Rectinemataceae bacterium]
MKRRVAVTGLGVVSPVGNDVASFWTALKEGRSGLGPITHFDASRVEAKVAAEVKNFDPTLYMDKKEARKMASFTQYGVAAAVQAWRDAGLGEGFRAPEGGEAPALPYSPERVATVMGIGIGGLEVMMESHKKMLESGPGRMLPMTVPLMISNECPANIAMRLGILGPAYTAVTACTSSTDALGQALDLIRSGRCDMAVAGGAEATITEFAIGAFCRLQALSTAFNDDPTKASRPFDKARDGFVMGEGAAALILEDYDKAVARGARIYAEFAGYGATCDAYHLTSPDPEGKGGARAIALALEDAELKPEDIGYYNAHGTSTQINDPTESLMVKHAFGEHAKKLKISSTKSMHGHMLGAAGAIEAVACIKAMEEGFIPPTINLDNPDTESGCDLDYVPNKGVHAKLDATASASLGFGGHNGVVVMRRPR